MRLLRRFVSAIVVVVVGVFGYLCLSSLGGIAVVK